MPISTSATRVDTTVSQVMSASRTTLMVPNDTTLESVSHSSDYSISFLRLDWEMISFGHLHLSIVGVIAHSDLSRRLATNGTAS